MSKKTNVTVVGYYTDNSQPFVCHIEADLQFRIVETQRDEIVDETRKELIARNDWDPKLEFMPFVIVEVFEGHHRGELCNDKTIEVTEDGAIYG